MPVVFTIILPICFVNVSHEKDMFERYLNLEDSIPDFFPEYHRAIFSLMRVAINYYILDLGFFFLVF